MKKKKEVKYATNDELDIFIAAKRLGSKGIRFYFRDIIERETGFKILPSTDEIIIFIQNKINKFLEYKGKGNINEQTQSGFGHFTTKELAEFYNWKTAGQYPDFYVPYTYIDDKGNEQTITIYVECKTESEKDSTARTFYYNSPKGIKEDAPHLLISLEYLYMEGKKQYTGKFCVLDLYEYDLTVFRGEINNNGSGNKGLYDLNSPWMKFNNYE
jgi:hypothetical protein